MTTPGDARPAVAGSAAPAVADLDRDVRRYYAGLAVGVLGGAVTAVALPLVALTVLGATPMQASGLVAAQRLPPLLTALVAGAWIDRRRKLPVLIWGKVLGALLLASIPLAATMGALTLAQLYVAGFLLAAVNDISSNAATSYLPSLVRGRRLLAANSRLGALFSLTDAAGTYLAAAVIAALGTARALYTDVAAYLASALWLTGIRTPEPPPQPRPSGATLRADIRDGLRYTLSHPALRPLVLGNAAVSFATTAVDTLFVIVVVRQLHWSPTALSIVMGCGSLGGIAGALLGRRLGETFGPGPVMITSLGLLPLTQLPILLAGPGTGWQVLIATGTAVRMGCAVAQGSTQRSTRQMITAPAYQARQQAVGTWLTYGPRPAAALGAGALATAVGLRPALAVAAAALTGGFLLLITAPALRGMRHLPDPPRAAEPHQEAAVG